MLPTGDGVKDTIARGRDRHAADDLNAEKIGVGQAATLRRQRRG